MNYGQKYKLSLKPYQKISSCSKLIGTALTNEFRKTWQRMCAQYSNDTGKVVASWGVPTEYVVKYFDIDIDRIKLLAEYEKKLNELDCSLDR